MKKLESKRKKLTLERSTVRNLSAEQLRQLAGAEDAAAPTKGVVCNPKPSIPCSWGNC